MEIDYENHGKSEEDDLILFVDNRSQVAMI
jgi:hypothetical protein